jgi:hypothetical protein
MICGTVAIAAKRWRNKPSPGGDSYGMDQCETWVCESYYDSQRVEIARDSIAVVRAVVPLPTRLRL